MPIFWSLLQFCVYYNVIFFSLIMHADEMFNFLKVKLLRRPVFILELVVHPYN